MKLVEQHIIKKNHQFYKDLKDLLHLSKNLYNASCYMIRQHYFRISGQQYTEDLIIEDKSYAEYYLINKYMHDSKNIDYLALPANTAQEVLKQVDKQYTSFFKLLKMKLAGKYSENVNIPGYKSKNGYNILIYNRMFISQKYLDKGIVKIPKTNIEIKVNKDKIKDFSQLRINLQGEEIILEFIYEAGIKEMLQNNGKYLALDLGVNNLAAVSSNCSKCFLINGKPLKQLNQKYNKDKAHLQEKLNLKQQVLNTLEDKNIEITDDVFKEAQKKNHEKIKYSSHRINKITEKRKHKIEDYLHKASRYVINQAVENQIGTIFIGHNNDWKQDINIGKENNQNFVSIPFNKFIHMIQYKGMIEGINVVVVEESYTSKASFLDNDFIPKYDPENESKYKFSGKRICRGLYRTAEKRLINADLNGSFNIMKKGLESLKINVKSDALVPGNIGFVFCPQKITFQKSKIKNIKH